MAKYIKCSRCELNYILAEEELCDVCKAELGLNTNITLLDDIMEEEDCVRLCPVCKTNTIGADEDICETCRLAREAELSHADDSDDWRSYIDDEPEDLEEGVDIPLEDLEEDDFDEQTFEDEENEEPVEFDDYVDVDDYDYDDDYDDEEEDDF